MYILWIASIGLRMTLHCQGYSSQQQHRSAASIHTKPLPPIKCLSFFFLPYSSLFLFVAHPLHNVSIESKYQERKREYFRDDNHSDSSRRTSRILVSHDFALFSHLVTHGSLSHCPNVSTRDTFTKLRSFYPHISTSSDWRGALPRLYPSVAQTCVRYVQ